MNFRSIIFFGVFLFTASDLVAQAGSKPSIKSTLNKNRILIGEPFQLTVESRIPGGAIVKPVRIDTIAHFEFLEKPVIDTTRNGKEVNIKGVYTLTSFDSGHWVIPSFSLSSAIKTDTLPVDVVFSEFNPEQDYHDIKDIIEVEQDKKKQKWWLYIIGSVLALALVLFLLRKTKKPIPAVLKAAETAHEEAMRELAKLKASSPPSKEFYSRLIDIFKLYVFRKKGILSLQKTTDDLVVQLRDLQLSKDIFDRLAQSLRLGDFVKFAKYIPSREDDHSAFESMKSGIDEIELLK